MMIGGGGAQRHVCYNYKAFKLSSSGLQYPVVSWQNTNILEDLTGSITSLWRRWQQSPL